MRYSRQIKPISYLKAHAADVLQELKEQRKPLIITQNGEAKAVLQDVASYEETQEMLALLKILALGSQQFEKGEVTSVSSVRYTSRFPRSFARISIQLKNRFDPGKELFNRIDPKRSLGGSVADSEGDAQRST
ncbi:MAG: type II toxin-antitoxin system Phd/YefM family antitoxin [Gammaproteobacteria bacterium]|nr:MAG: type II toxin-antitoxin system Phd/YefM family antitoxin [Gammaproteobacteria bacterium]